MEITQKVIELIAEHLCRKPETVKLENNIITELGADSIDIIQMLTSLETEFSITFDDSEISTIRTVSDIVKFIEARKK
ncbi:MAG: acyl carrier protein [Christensenellaceae bacterium]|jgi:acyl carrier protein|nr:acyl carrier protein [Christensenellaceae bacterium]